MATRHIAIETWLEALGMLDYLECFAAYNGVEELLTLSEAEVRDLGLKNPAHRAKIVSSLRILKEKYERGTGQGKRPPGQLNLQRNQNATAQLSWSPPSFVNSPDYQVVNTSPEKLQQDLLIELQGDPADLKSKAWYHGSVSRQRAENLVKKNGDFLVRDCISKPGDFVLTCCWKGGPLHFVINSTVIDQGPNRLPRVTYHFEDVHFNSVQELIQFYMDECKQITEISGAVITTPIARSMPLSYYDSKYGGLSQATTGSHYSAVTRPNMLASSPQATSGGSPRASPRSSPHGTPGNSPASGSPAGSPNSGRRGKVERSGSQPHLSVSPMGAMSMDRSGSMPVIGGIYKQVTPTMEHAISLEEDSGIYKQVTPVVTSQPNFQTSVQTNIQGTVQTPPVQSQSRPPAYIHQRSGSAPVLTPGVTVTQHFDYLAPPRNLTPASSDSDLHKAPPPKPSRIPSVKYKKKPQVVIRNVQLYEDDSRDYSDIDQVTSSPSWLKTEQANKMAAHNQNMQHSLYDNNLHKPTQSNISVPNHDVNQNIPQKDSRKISDTRYSVLDGHDYSDIPAFPLELNLKHNTPAVPPKKLPPQSRIKIPHIETEPSYDLQKYNSVLLPNENKLLEPSVLLKMRQAILMTEASVLARYLTSVDLQILNVMNEEDLGMCVTSGLELLTLPQGKQLRQDLIERTFCLKSFVMVMILTCPKVVDRAAVLSQWIQVAMETHVTMGNLFGFENIMAGLMSDQIIRLRDTWMVLRQNHTNSAFVFDTKLKSAYRTLQDGSGTLPVQDISIPSIAPIVKLLEMTLDKQDMSPNIMDINNDLDIMLIHLDMARVITAQCGVYRVVGKSRMQKLTPDNEKVGMFETEFQMRFLWGSKGAGVNRTERHNKFTLLLKAYSEKLEQDGDDGTAV